MRRKKTKKNKQHPVSHENRSYRQVLYECDCADTDRVCIDDLADGDVNNWLGYGDQV